MQFHAEHDYAKHLDAGLWRRVLGYAKPFHPHLIAVSVLMLLCAGIDVLFPLLTREAIDVFIANGTTQGLERFAVKYALAVVAQASTIGLFIFLCGRVEAGVCHLIREMGFKRLQELSFSYYDKTPVGYILSRMTSDTQRLGDTIGWSLIDLMWGSGFVVISVAVMLSINLTMSIALIVIMPALALISAYFQKRILASYRQVRRTNSLITGAFNEGIIGARTSKTLVREDANAQEFFHLTQTMRNHSVRAAVLSALFMPLVMSLGSIVASYALWRGGYEVFTGAISLGTLTLFMSYSVQIFEPITNIARVFAELQSAQAAAERVITLIETQPDIRDSSAVEALYGDNFCPKRENWPKLKGEITFENVSFQYAQGEKVLDDFSLHIAAGQTIALVGETGSGKSTIVNLLCRFYEPTSGRILIDGEDYRTRSQLWLQSNLGYVLQQPHLFSGTIRENIRYGWLDATDEDVERAARLVDAESFILKFERGYDTDVGEGGGRLSTGQKQLLSFARALIADPAVFVLDEATSSVDTETEQRISRAITTALEGRTSFVIAHRLSTIRSADLILVVQDGRVIEQGNHRELLKKRGHYFNLYTTQFQKEREEALLGHAVAE
jgi:ATP-binding cassette subfamily B protein